MKTQAKPGLRGGAAVAGLALMAQLTGGTDDARAHHSQTFFADEIVEYSGELLDLEWRNPHVNLVMSVGGVSGVAEEWTIEFDSIYVLRRMGVTQEHFPIGETIRVAAHPSTMIDSLALGMTMMRADGQEVMLNSIASPRFSDQIIGIAYGANNEETVVDAAAEDRGIFRVWSSPRLGYHETYLPFRDEAVAARSEFNLADNFATRCEPEGMPRVMRNPHPFEFIDQSSEILIRSELYDLVRTIHMSDEPVPEDAMPSPLGYSVGRWEGQTLVVTTSRINWPYFDNVGTPQSTDVEVVERFALSDDQTRIDYLATVFDPATFTEPATITGHWLALGESVETYSCVAY